MPQDNVASPRPERLRGPDVALLSQPEHFTPDQSAGSEPARGADQHNQGKERYPFPHGEHQQENEQPGNSERTVNQSHEPCVHHTPPVTRHQSNRSTDGDRECHCQERNAERDSGTGHYPRQHVAIELVRSKGMSRPRRKTPCQDIRLGQGIGQKPGAHYRPGCNYQ
jgi:hypothetical protein